MDALASPYWPGLKTAVDAAYDAFGREPITAPLDVCLCPVCMTEETRGKIIGTRNDALPEDLIQEYSNSAHGVPVDLDNLRLLLPRYLELMAEDAQVDHIGVGTELSRFGDALRAHPTLFSPTERAALDTWARAMIWQFAWLDTTEEGAVLTPFHLVEVLICGGWAVSVVTDALEAVFKDDEIGVKTLQAFAAAVMSRPLRKHDRLGVDWFALQYTSDAVRHEVADWLNTLAGSEWVLDLASDPDVADTWGSLQGFAWAAGTFDAALMKGSG